MTDRIYTRTGDDGTTSLVGGERVPKNSLRVAAYGTIDEANSHIGLARAAIDTSTPDGATMADMLVFAQHKLFNCSSRTATPDDELSANTPGVAPADIETLETYIDTLLVRTGDVGHFVLPGGAEASARLHVARTVVRRAERGLLDLAADETVDSDVLGFVNRLSDLLFALARFANTIARTPDTIWDPTL